MNNKQLIQQVFKEVMENLSVDPEIIGRFFSQDYIQHVDGKVLNYADFVRHMNALAGATATLTISVHTIVAEGEIVFTNHHVDGYLKNGKRVEGQVIAEFRVRDGKICSCDELTRMVAGGDEARDLGSRMD